MLSYETVRLEISSDSFKGIYSVQCNILFDKPAIPEEMIDNVCLDELAYTGYKVQAQKNDGTIFKAYGFSAKAYGSKVSYSFVKYGKETVSKSGTVTGLAPDIAGFGSR